jgi:hypothetical protein
VFKATCTEPKAPWSPEKDQFGQRIKALGLWVSTVPGVTITVPDDKLVRIRVVLSHTKRIGFVMRTELELVLGVINFVKVGVRHAKPFAADLWDLLSTMDRDKPWKPVRIPAYVHDTIEFLCEFAEAWNGVAIRDKAVTVPAGHFRSDAAGNGTGAEGKGAMALLGRVWWFDCVNEQAIAERELVAAVVMDVCIAALCPGTGVGAELHTVATEADNQVVLRWLEKGRAKRYLMMNRAL